MEKEFSAVSIAGSATVPFRGVSDKSPASQRDASMNVLSKLYYRYKKILKVVRLFLIIADPGIIVMVADNDAGGITTYTATLRRSRLGVVPYGAYAQTPQAWITESRSAQNHGDRTETGPA